MTNASAAKGTRFEHAVKRDLESRGYFCMRSPASKSPIDILAVGPGDVLFVQAKTTGRLDPGPWNELLALARTYGGTALLAYKAPRSAVPRYVQLIGFKDARLTRNPPVDEWPAEAAA